jgi:hypothetical protein
MNEQGNITMMVFDHPTFAPSAPYNRESAKVDPGYLDLDVTHLVDVVMKRFTIPHSVSAHLSLPSKGQHVGTSHSLTDDNGDERQCQGIIFHVPSNQPKHSSSSETSRRITIRYVPS